MMSMKPENNKRATVANIAGGSTRKMAASRYVVALSILVLLWLGIYLYANNVRNIVSLGLPGTLVVGVGFLLFIKYLEKKGSIVIDRAKRADRGAVAEERVGDFLNSLPEGNFIIHDFNSGKGNIDHILINTKGIFTLETKSHNGDVTFDGEKLLRGKHPFEKDFLSQAWAECFAVRNVLQGWGITSPKAEPIILFTNAYVKVRGKAKGVEILSLKYLPKFLERLPDRQTIPEAGRIYNRVKAASQST
jgi:hypothetical protein